MEITFYGTRGSVPAPLVADEIFKKVFKAATAAFSEPNQPKTPEEVEAWVKKLPFTVRGTYGGNTTCCSVRCGEVQIVCDLGTGVRLFGKDILPRMFKEGGIPIFVLMSHVHWDHVQGFPFYAPLFIPKSVLPKNKMSFHGGTDWLRTLEEVLRGQMDPPQFPVEWKKVALEGPEMVFDGIFNAFSTILSTNGDETKVTCVRLHHPNETYGWRIEYNGNVFVFATDTEPFDGGPDPALVKLAAGADILYIDCQFSKDQYLGRAADGLPRLGWGHGYDQWAAEVARVARVKKLVLGHYDPGASDEQIATMVGAVRSLFPNTIGSYDGLKMTL